MSITVRHREILKSDQDVRAVVTGRMWEEDHEVTGTGSGATPTLAEVLAAGNDPGSTYPTILGASGGSGADGRAVLIAGGDGDLPGADSSGASITLGNGYGNGDGGVVNISPGNAGTGSGRGGGDVTIILALGDGAGANGSFVIVGLPTSPPGTQGALWNDNGTVKVVT